MPGADYFQESSYKARDFVRSYGKGVGVSGVRSFVGFFWMVFWLYDS